MNSPNKKERRRERLKQAHEEQLAREMARVRRVDEDFHARLIVGFRRVQVFVLPSFDVVRSWDVREGSGAARDGLALYYSEGPAGQAEVLSPGYRRVACPSDVLAGFVDRLSAMRVCPVPPPLTHSGLDGAIYGVSIFGDLRAECRLRWWDEPPADWADVGVVVREMITAFEACPLAEGLV